MAEEADARFTAASASKDAARACAPKRGRGVLEDQRKSGGSASTQVSYVPVTLSHALRKAAFGRLAGAR